MNLFARLKARLAAAFASLFTSAPDFRQPGLAVPVGITQTPARRTPHRHRAMRLAAGIPHGTPGAKLARKALTSSI